MIDWQNFEFATTNSIVVRGTSPLVDLAEINPKKQKKHWKTGLNYPIICRIESIFAKICWVLFQTRLLKKHRRKIVRGAVSGATSMLGLGGVPGAIIGASSGAFGQGAAELDCQPNIK